MLSLAYLQICIRSFNFICSDEISIHQIHISGMTSSFSTGSITTDIVYSELWRTEPLQKGRKVCNILKISLILQPAFWSSDLSGQVENMTQIHRSLDNSMDMFRVIQLNKCYMNNTSVAKTCPLDRLPFFVELLSTSSNFLLIFAFFKYRWLQLCFLIVFYVIFEICIRFKYMVFSGVFLYIVATPANKLHWFLTLKIYFIPSVIALSLNLPNYIYF